MTIKHKLGARAGKYKFGASAGNWGRKPGLGLGAGAGGWEI